MSAAVMMAVRSTDATSVIPALLGFHPAESAVILCLDSKNRITVTARIDVPLQPGGAKQLAEVAARHADRVVLVVYTDRPDINVAPLVEAVQAHRPVLNVVRVGNDAQPVDPQVAAAHALAGRAVLADREELARSVAHRQGVAGNASAGIADLMATAEDRDAYLAANISSETALRDLITAAQGTADDDPAAADILAVLAAVAYRRGDGALAQVALDRARRCNPAHRLALLLASAVGMGIPPAKLDALARG